MVIMRKSLPFTQFQSIKIEYFTSDVALYCLFLFVFIFCLITCANSAEVVTKKTTAHSVSFTVSAEVQQIKPFSSFRKLC